MPPDHRKAEFDALFAKLLLFLAALAHSFALKHLTAQQFGALMLMRLESDHARAYWLGSVAGGSLQAFGPDARTFGQAMADEETPYLDRFVADLSAGRYQGEAGTVDEAAITRRTRLYALKLEASVNAGWVQASPPGSTFDWVLSQAEHCAGCAKLAKNSPYTAETLPTYPRKGDTECLFNCECRLRRSDGVYGFQIEGG